MNTWIFQGNPKTYQIDVYLRSRVGKQVIWEVSQQQYRHAIAIGDEVFIWRADGGRPRSGGVVGRGLIATLPAMIEDGAPELWKEKRLAHVALRVVIDLLEVRLTTAEGMLTRDQIYMEPALADLTILRMAQRTNYRLAPDQAEALRRLWQQPQVDE